ncbi:NAD-dependent epimerase/dehydratase family protein [Rhizobium rosettiformans]|uniref:NAD-dependent epimerase/dehydratase family protein n=1 Tax=Rhizobium rosettiformans TaxID=1368430 RepID=A0ABX7EWU8_9HYPH|nr:NAD-dependent epimerase/dehydratase family protein [Rhizobium rosettiformans]ODS56609.1 MAG: 3-beta hydroxysteroid dehydrogenase [Agrobacterium sp. SCN 61-19]QRF52599.1 NAD-dependent epimerase/dehydratase family protein [Rhizobium rosettiformans]
MSSISTQPTPRLALVTGGSGFVGGHLIRRLLSDGWRVRALGRSTEALAGVQAMGAEPVAGDLVNLASLTQAMEGVEVVFHVAAHFKLWGPMSQFRQINVDGTRNVVEAAERAGVRRVVYVSAAAVIMGLPGPMHGATEAMALHKMSFAPYATSKAEAEEVLLAANGRRAGFSTVALRPPFIWGPDMPALDHMIETVRNGQFRWVGGGGQALSTCHVDNLCHALVLAADRGSGGEAFFVSDGEDTTLKSFLTRLLGSRGVTPKDRSVPFGVAWAMAGLMGAVWQAFRRKGEPPISRQMLRLIGKDFTIDISRARDELGYAPVISPADGMRRMCPGDAAPANTAVDQTRLAVA